MQAWYDEANQIVDQYKIDMRDGGRGNYLPFPKTDELDALLLVVNKAFGCTATYLVGSATFTKAYRDVDLRLIMDDAKFAQLFGTVSKGAFQSLLEVSISTWLAEKTGLPIDFQIQSMTAANKRYPKKRRNAMGLYSDSYYQPEYAPPWRVFGDPPIPKVEDDDED